MLMRLTGRLKSEVQALFIGVLAGLLVISMLACPFWMGSLNHCNMPCSKESSSHQCPLVVCQVSAPYLAADGSFHAPPLKDLPAELIVSPILWTSLRSAESIRQDGAPPGPSRPLFLQTHSFLI
jgi:hypothetical protein